MVGDGVRIQEKSMRIHGIRGRRLVHTNTHAQSKTANTIREQRYKTEMGKLSLAIHPPTYRFVIVDTVKQSASRRLI